MIVSSISKESTLYAWQVYPPRSLPPSSTRASGISEAQPDELRALAPMAMRGLVPASPAATSTVNESDNIKVRSAL